MYVFRHDFIEITDNDSRIRGFICLREGVEEFPDSQDADEPEEDLLPQPGAGAPFQSWVDYFIQNTGYYLTVLNGIQFYLTLDYNAFLQANPQLSIQTAVSQFNAAHSSEIDDFKNNFKALCDVLFDKPHSPHKTLYWPLWTLPDSPIGYLLAKKDPNDNSRKFEITARFFPDHAADMVVNYALIIVSQHEPGPQPVISISRQENPGSQLQFSPQENLSSQFQSSPQVNPASPSPPKP